MGAHTCLVCGAKEYEVAKMHYFPANLERSRIWQVTLGFKYTGQSLKNRRICSNHFSSDAYINRATYQLRRDAVPNPFVGTPSTSVSPATTTSTSQVIPVSEETIKNDELTETYTVGQDVSNSIICTDPCTSIVPEASSSIMGPDESGGIICATPSTSTPVASSSLTMEPVISGFTKSRKKIFKTIGDLQLKDFTPRKKKLVDIIHKKTDQLRKVKYLCKKRLFDMKSVSNLADSNVVHSLFENMSSVTANFMISQIKNSRAKSVMGRRWTLEDKLLALCIFKRSPRCYSLLRRFFALPHKRTLLALLEKIPFDAGINNHIFKQLNEKLPEGLDRSCVLLFDECDLQENVQYDLAADKILGFEDFGSIDSPGERKFANKALVFMLVGLNMKWKQPVAFYFNCNGCNSTILQQCILAVLKAAKNYGNLNVVATVCDMGVSNVKCMKQLGVTVETPFFMFQSKKVYTLYDPPHLLKCTFSLFRKHNILLPCSIGNEETKTMMEARIQDIRKAYLIDKNNPYVFRTMHKIKDTHLEPVMKYAMKVCVAAQVLSHTTGAFLYSLVSLGVLESRAVATATFVKEVDTLFDSFNGRSKNAPEGKKLRSAVYEGSPHHKYWLEASDIVKNWTFKRLNKSGSIKSSRPPSQIGWLVSLNAIQGIWKELASKGISMLRPRSLNQDPLENLFGAIRNGCGCNDNPNVKQFIGSLKTQILNGLTNQNFSGTNCEEDDNILLSNLRSFLDITTEQFEEGHSQGQKKSEISDENVLDELVVNMSADVCTGNINILSVAYVAGFIVKTIFKNHNCELCNSLLVSHDFELHNLYISNKEWVDSKKSLIYPSEAFTIVVGNGVTLLESYLDKFASQKGIMSKAQHHLMSNTNFDWLTCSNHTSIIASLTIKSICRIGIPWWCRRQNQYLKELKKEKRSTKKKVKKFKHL